MYISSKSYFISFHVYKRLLLLSMILFVCHIVPPCDFSIGIVSLHQNQFFDPSVCHWIQGFSNGVDLWGDNLDKMAKNCLKMTKSAFLGVKTVGGQANVWASGGIPPPSPA